MRESRFERRSTRRLAARRPTTALVAALGLSSTVAWTACIARPAAARGRLEWTRVFAYHGPERLALATGERVRLADPRTGEALGAIDPGGPLLDLASLDASGRWLALLGGRDASVRILDEELGPLGDGVRIHSSAAPRYRLVGQGAGERLALVAIPDGLAELDLDAGTTARSWPWPGGLLPLDGSLRADRGTAEAVFPAAGPLDQDLCARCMRLDRETGGWRELGPWYPPSGRRPRLLAEAPERGLALGFRDLEQPTIEFVDPRTGEQLARSELDISLPKALALSPDGRRLALARANRSIGPPLAPTGAIGGELIVLDASSGERVASRTLAAELDPARPPKRLAIAEDLCWLDEGHVLTLDRHDGRLTVSVRLLPGLEPTDEILLEDLGEPAFLAAAGGGQRAAICWRGRSVVVLATGPLREVANWPIVDERDRWAEHFALARDGAHAIVAGLEGGLAWIGDPGADAPPRVALPEALDEIELLHIAVDGSVRLWGWSGDERLRRIVGWSLTLPADRAAARWHETSSLPAGDAERFDVDPEGRTLARYVEGPGRGELVAWRPADGALVWQRWVPFAFVTCAETDGVSELAVAFDGADELLRFGLADGAPSP